MSDIQNMNVFDLICKLNPSDQDLCVELDPFISDKLVSLDSLAEIYYYVCYGNLHEILKHTKNKINSLLDKHISDEHIDWWRFQAYQDWLSEELKNKLVSTWINTPDVECTWLANSVSPDSELVVGVLNKLTSVYKLRKSSDNIKVIESLFTKVPKKYLDEACKIIEKSTPAVSVCLLFRDDVNENFTLRGLKSLSKLSKQRDIVIKINFDMLKHLGPKARLDAMKQLLGMMENKRTLANNPFDKVPNREDIELFLFPCSLKYNEQVVELMNEFDKIAIKH